MAGKKLPTIHEEVSGSDISDVSLGWFRTSNQRTGSGSESPLDFLGIPPSDQSSTDDLDATATSPSDNSDGGGQDDSAGSETRQSSESTPPPRKQPHPKRRRNLVTREIIRLQSTTNLLIPRLPFQRQNRAWEKDRRDRLNNTFDKLAKLLPEYRPKINFSKIEILHKSIVYIEDLRKKLHDALSTQNTSTLKTQDDLEESVKALVCQNNNLVELLEKANIKVPHFVRPKVLSNISITVCDKNAATEPNHDDDDDDEIKKCKSEIINKSPPKICKITQNKTKCNTNKTTEVIVELSTNNHTSYDKPLVKSTPSPEKQNGKLQSHTQQKQDIQQEIPTQKPQLNAVPELKEVQSFGSVDVIPVSNGTKQDPKVHEKPVKNFVEITPLISGSGQNEKIATKPEKSDDVPAQPKSTICIEESKIDKKSENVLNVSAILTNVQPSNDSNTIARPELKDKTGGVVIAAVIDKSKRDKSKATSKQKETVVHSKCDKQSPIKKSDSKEQNVPVANQSTISTNNIAFETSGNGLRNAAKIFCTENEQNKSTNDSIKAINNSNKHQNVSNEIVPSNETQHHSGKRVEHSMVLSKDELNDSISNEKDLPDELFGNFRLDQTPNESNPNTLSPTAAFLLSFPVVSTVSSAKPTETDNSYSVGSSNLLRLDEKPNQPKDHCLFESISSILNDLNDVSESKIVSNVDNSHATSFTYCSSNKNRTNVEPSQKQSISLNDGACNGPPRQKLNQKNLHINNLLSDDKVKYNSASVSSSSSSAKQQSASATKKIDSAEFLPNSQMIVNPTTNDRTNFMSSSKSYENCVTTAHNENASDFYVSLSTLGLPLKSTVPLPPSTSINPSVGSHFNFQISSLAQPRNLIEPLVADTPFTFSLTKNSDTTTITSNVTTKPTVTQTDDQYQVAGHRSNKISHKKTTPTKHLVNDRFVMPTDPPLTTLNRCNSFNPFSFDNPTMLTNPSSSSIGLPNLTTVSSTNSSIGTSFTFTLTPSFTTISTSTPLISNHDPLFSSSFDMPLMRSTNALNPKTPKKEKPFVSYSNEKELQSNSWKNSATKSCAVQPVKSNKNLVNWMTSTVNKPTSSAAASASAQDLQLDFIPQVASHCVGIEEPSPWSPNRIAMDNPGLISSSALPMLQGDLALNTMSNPPPPPPLSANKLYETDSSKKSTARQSNNQSKYTMKSSNNNRKPDHQSVHQTDHRSAKCSKTEKISNHTFKSHHQSSSSSSSRLGSESGPITNNFHSVSQLLDQERQTVNKNSYYIPPNDGKMLFKDSNSTMSMAKSKYYPKYDIDTSNHHHHHHHHQMSENKYTTNACNTISGNVGGSGNSSSNNNNNIVVSGSEISSNDCDRDLFGGYFFGQSKRLKLNYHHTSSSDHLSSNQTTYDNLSANDLTSSYVNYQTYDNDCNNISANSCINNLANQTYSYQYTQPQSYAHQTQQQPLNPSCDSLEPSAYFQATAPVSTLCSYKPPTFNDVSRSDSKLTSTHQPSSSSFLHQPPSKSSSILAAAAPPPPVITSTDYISNTTKICSASSISSNSISSATANYPSQMPMGSVNRSASTCPTKTIHYPSHTNINHNLPLNQAWNDGFTWMPYTTNPIDKPYNNNLVFNTTTDTASSSNKTITSNNIAGSNNNNTIPNFNLTTIFPDYNKS